jgi:hypothetical protein
MNDAFRKLCLFLFLAAILSPHGSSLATLIAASAGTVLLWPFYKKYAPPSPQRRMAFESAEPASPQQP